MCLILLSTPIAVFWHNTDTHHADVQQLTLGVNVTVSDTSHAVARELCSKSVLCCYNDILNSNIRLLYSS
jgi:hypothetical protein